MNYLAGEETQANVAILWVVSRWLNHVGASSFRDLTVALRPPSVVKGAENALLASLLVGRHIGILQAEVNDGPWSLGARLAPDAIDDHRRFRKAVREAVLHQAVEDAQQGRRPADVALGLTWLGSLDPTAPPAYGWNEGAELAVYGAGLGGVIKNSDQWRAFRRWAIGLGMAVANNPRGGVQVLVPDLTTAVLETLPDLPVRSTAPAFLEVLAGRLPAVDTGALQRTTVDLGLTNKARDESTIGPCLAYALRRLHRRGKLCLEKADDASHRVSYRTAAGVDTFDFVTLQLVVA
jgi:hypothetical protein